MRLHAYKGSFFWELQVGPLVFQWARDDYRARFDVPRFRVWRDPYWRLP